MVNDKEKVLAVIPARGGSKGVPKKNIKLLGGKPLIQWSIEAALEATSIDRVIISTDCDEIASVSKKLGCEVPFKRPSYLSTDNANTIDVISHAIDTLESDYDWVVLLQPTSPFRRPYHIDDAFQHMLKNYKTSCVGVVEANKSPEWMFWLSDDKKHLNKILNNKSPTRRQDCRPTYLINGAIYISKIDEFKENRRFLSDDTFPYVMGEKDSLDIDSYIDFKMAEIIIGELDD